MLRARLTPLLLALTLLLVPASAQRRPVLSATPPPDASARCRDGYYSFSRHRRGTCSGHGGVAEWLGRFANRGAQTDPPAVPPPERAGCDPTLWQHVYHPRRLKVVGGCVTITGTLLSVQPESDGDLHIRVRPDPEFRHLLNAHNGRGEGAGLVVEPVCVGGGGHGACRDFRQTIMIPKVGARVRVTGEHVRDLHHHWMEIHPVTSIMVIP